MTIENWREDFDKRFPPSFISWPSEGKPIEEREYIELSSYAVPSKSIKAFIESLLAASDKEWAEKIEKACDEQTMERIWNLDGATVSKYIHPDYKPHCMPYRPSSKKEYEDLLAKGSCEMYQVGFVRGETWGAQKLKRTLLPQSL